MSWRCRLLGHSWLHRNLKTGSWTADVNRQGWECYSCGVAGEVVSRRRYWDTSDYATYYEIVPAGKLLP